MPGRGTGINMMKEVLGSLFNVGADKVSEALVGISLASFDILYSRTSNKIYSTNKNTGTIVSLSVVAGGLSVVTSSATIILPPVNSLGKLGIITPQMFGATGLGIDDDTSAFNLASALSPKGVYVPDGLYYLPNNITGKFYGPGRRVTTSGSTVSIPFSNPASSLGNTILGYDAGKNYAGDDITGQVTLLGTGAGRNLSTATNVVAIGNGVLTGDTLSDALTDTSLCTGMELIGIGVNALKKAVTLTNSIGIGRDALNENKFGQYNTAIGMSALQQLHTGEGNTALGRAAGMRSGITTDANGKRLSFDIVNGCTFIGNAAGRENKSGNYNTYLGNAAGRGITSTTNEYTGTSTGSYNTGVGVDALSSIGSGSNNTVIGAGAAKSLIDGSNNIFIGKDAGSSITTGDNQFIVASYGSLPYLQGLMAGPQDTTNFLRVDGSLQPAVTGTRTLGSPSRIWSYTYSQKYMFTATVGAFYGAGSPEGVVSAGIGSTYHRTDGGAGTSMYVKESGTGNAGWVAK